VLSRTRGLVVDNRGEIRPYALNRFSIRVLHIIRTADVIGTCTSGVVSQDGGGIAGWEDKVVIARSLLRKKLGWWGGETFTCGVHPSKSTWWELTEGQVDDLTN
jgi:hypothetical protein